MADQKKLVAEITSMDEDFTQWYTDVVIKAGLIAYSNIKGFMVAVGGSSETPGCPLQGSWR